MHIQEVKQHLIGIDERIKLARDYSSAREKAAKAKVELEMILVANLREIREEKSNVGYEMALLILLEPGMLFNDVHDVAIKLYKEMNEETARYKGLEKLLDAYETKTTYIQSVMRYERENT